MISSVCRGNSVPSAERELANYVAGEIWVAGLSEEAVGAAPYEATISLRIEPAARLTFCNDRCGWQHWPGLSWSPSWPPSTPSMSSIPTTTVASVATEVAIVHHRLLIGSVGGRGVGRCAATFVAI
jgi:hypothetical protein